MDISVVIVNYNTFELTCECIESLKEHTAAVSYEIIVVDNASPDGSGRRLKERYPDLTVILNPENSGFGRGNNLGIQQASGRYLFLLNSDTVVLNNALKILFDFAEHYPGRLGVAGTMLLDRECKPHRSSSDLPTGWRIVKWTAVGYLSRFLLRRRTSFRQQPFPEGCNMMQVGAVVGADMFIPAAVFHEIGGFDPFFFMYYEETDLQYRMAKRGYDRVLVKGPEIIHLEGSSSPPVKRYLTYYRSMFHYIGKHRLFLPF